MRDVLVDGLGVDDAAVGKHDPLLPRHVGIVVGNQEVGDRGARQEVAFHDGLGLRLVHVAVEEPAPVRLPDLHQRLGVTGADAAGGHHGEGQPAAAHLAGQRLQHDARPAAMPQELMPTATSARALIFRLRPRPRSCPACRR